MIKNETIEIFKKIVPVVGVIIIIIIAFVWYFNSVYTKECNTFECFQKSMGACDRASYLNEATEATWKYKILGESNNECNIDVTILQAKKGDLGLDKLSGYSMVCTYPRGVATYPDQKLELCHGRLKEELQGIIIQKLHVYILENLGKFDEALNKAV